ncbi:MAG: ferredoxin [Candidatus Margulisbacteria bacterium]|nr:ferredoxin [Candidatus Margulisiibacteriota bacterium]
MTIIINDQLCIGCGVCAAMDEEIFVMDEESGLAKVRSQNIKNKELLEEIIDTCPVNAISIIE